MSSTSFPRRKPRADSPASVVFPALFEREEWRFLIRYLGPADTECFRAFFLGLSPETIRCRYGHMISGMTTATAQRLVSVDPLTEPALAIFDAEETTIYAVGRYYFNAGDESAEIAIVVAEAMRRVGLGRQLLNTLIELARGRGVKTLYAYVMTTDAPVLRLLKSVGFHAGQRTEDGELKCSLAL